jgi:hypothetical protein
MIENVLIGIVGLLLYASGLVVWPVCALFWRKKKRHTKALRWTFLCELACQLVIIGFFIFSRGILEHQYGWLVFSILVNIVFTPAMILAAFYDYSKQAPAA